MTPFTGNTLRHIAVMILRKRAMVRLPVMTVHTGQVDLPSESIIGLDITRAHIPASRCYIPGQWHFGEISIAFHQVGAGGMARAYHEGCWINLFVYHGITGIQAILPLKKRVVTYKGGVV